MEGREGGGRRNGNENEEGGNFLAKYAEVVRSMIHAKPPQYYVIQRWTKEWSLGCVNLCPAARVSKEAGFKQPRDHSFAQPCTSLLYACS